MSARQREYPQALGNGPYLQDLEHMGAENEATSAKRPCERRAG